MNQSETVKQQNPLGYERIGKLLCAFAIPSIISCLVNSIYNIVDQIFIGQGVGYLGNAATTVAFPVVTIVMAFATLLGTGGSSYAAIKLGEKENAEAEKTLNNLFTLSVGLGVIVMLLGLVFLEPILRLFGATDMVMPYAKEYTSIILIGVPFNVLGIALSGMARTDGNPRLSMYSVLIGAALNTILDPIYIFVFHWGVKGAAIATTTAQVLTAVMLLYYFIKHGNMKLDIHQMGLQWRVCKMTLSIGASAGITSLVACLMQVVMNNSLVKYGNQSAVGGEVALSAMGIVMKIAMILGSVCIGIGIGSQPILGFNRGAGLPKRIQKTYLTAVGVATISITVGWLVCQLFPHVILRLFGDANDNFTVFAVRCMRMYLFGIFCAGFQIVSTNYFQATGQPLKASLLSMLRQLLLLIPLLLILPLFWGLDGILYAGPIADISSAVIVALFMIPEMKKLSGWIETQNAENEVCTQS